MSRHEREQRILRHARRGYALAQSDAAYLETAMRRLGATLAAEPATLWEAIDWLWAAVLGHVEVAGPLREEIRGGAAVLEALLAGDDAAIDRWAAATGDRLSLWSTLSSHPFPDQASWLLRKTSLAS